jgi:HD-like signal output (HDOD) protein
MRQSPTVPLLDKSKATAVRLQEILADLNKLPTLPAVATRAMAMANDQNSSLMDFSQLVQRDPPIAAGLLKLANSPLYMTGKAVQSVDQAVVKLGLRICQDLIVAVGMRSMFQSLSAARLAFCEQLWEHSFLTGMVCQKVNKTFNLRCGGEEFTAGLLHDLGRILIAIACPQDIDLLGVVDLVEAPDVLRREQEAVGADHCHLGSWFAAQNKLPSGIVPAIRYHHTPAQAPTGGNLVALVALAEHVGNYLLGENSPEDYRPEANEGFRCLAAQWREETREKAARLMPLIVAESVQILHLSRKALGG